MVKAPCTRPPVWFKTKCWRWNKPCMQKSLNTEISFNKPRPTLSTPRLATVQAVSTTQATPSVAQATILLGGILFFLKQVQLAWTACCSLTVLMAKHFLHFPSLLLWNNRHKLSNFKRRGWVSANISRILGSILSISNYLPNILIYQPNKFEQQRWPGTQTVKSPKKCEPLFFSGVLTILRVRRFNGEVWSNPVRH